MQKGYLQNNKIIKVIIVFFGICTLANLIVFCLSFQSQISNLTNNYKETENTKQFLASTQTLIQIKQPTITLNQTFLNTNINIGNQATQKLAQSKINEKDIGEQQKQKVIFIQQIDRNILSMEQRQKNAQKRMKMGQPKLQQRKLRFWLISNSFQSPKCAIVNAISILTPTIKQTAQSLFSDGRLSHIIIIADRSDKFAKKLIYDTFSNEKIKYYDFEIDSDYKFIRSIIKQINCTSIAYLHHNFAINSTHALSLRKQMNQISQFKVLHSRNAIYKNKQVSLANLKQTDLQKLDAISLNKYVILFSYEYLNVITPLNFAYMAKYTIEEIIIMPLLAISQKYNALQAFTQILYSFNESQIQFKYFAISQPQQQPNSVCFVSYPSNPYQQSYSQLKLYLQSVQQMNKSNSNISIVIFLPYSYQSIYKYSHPNILLNLRINNFRRVRFQIKAKTVSSLSTYQAAYMYCPNKAIIVASRHNIQFKSNFATDIVNSMQSKYHYYYVPYVNENSQPVFLPSEEVYHQKQGFLRQNFNYYDLYFKHVQIFKSDLMKTNYFWSLKSAQIDFYQSQASFVIPMLQMVQMQISIIRQTSFNIKLRQKSEKQIKNQINLKKHKIINPLPQNKLSPLPFNCLVNQAFRLHAKNKIPKKLHQIWIDEQIPQSIQKLQHSIKMANPSFELFLWRKQNITMQNLPYSHSLIAKILQYYKQQTKIYRAIISSLISYQIIYSIGGIYIDMSFIAIKSLQPFLKYQTFFINSLVPNSQIYGIPYQVGNMIMGGVQYNYYFKFILTQIVNQNRIYDKVTNLTKSVGQEIIRKSFNDQQLFHNFGFGFHLFAALPQNNIHNLCNDKSVQNQIHQHIELKSKTNKIYKLPISCLIQAEEYAISLSIIF